MAANKAIHVKRKAYPKPSLQLCHLHACGVLQTAPQQDLVTCTLALLGTPQRRQAVRLGSGAPY
jgi:hypothetical protein